MALKEYGRSQELHQNPPLGDEAVLAAWRAALRAVTGPTASLHTSETK
jgi:hypothetical protein